MPLAEVKRIHIEVEGTLEISVWASELDMIAVVNNLVDNAIRYTPQGGRVDLFAGTRGEHVLLRIPDTGPGIPAAEQDKVFAAFYRTLGSERMGSGLGLSIVQAILERMGGEIWLDFSDAIKQTGLLVTVLVPMAAPSQTARKATSAMRVYACKRMNKVPDYRQWVSGWAMRRSFKNCLAVTRRSELFVDIARIVSAN